MELTLKFDVPHKWLRPNARVVWQAKHRLTKQAVEKGKREMFKASKDLGPFIITGYSIRHFYKARPIDSDNLLASMKGILDGVAQAANQDDKSFVCRGVDREKGTENFVRLTLELEELS